MMLFIIIINNGNYSDVKFPVYGSDNASGRRTAQPVPNASHVP